MTPQSIQKFFVLVIWMTFSSFFLHAQSCKGPNKTLVCQCARYSDYYCYYVCKCIRLSQLKEHLKSGWTLSSTSASTKSNTLFYVSVINSTSISFALAKPQRVSLKIYDVTGRSIKILADDRMPEGAHQIDWNKKDEVGKTISSGFYILQFNAGSYSGSQRFAIT